jgi:hypothetical protein
MARPDYNISMLNTVTDQKNNYCGGGWVKPDGSIAITLNLGVVLTSDYNIAIRMFPVDKERPKPATVKRPKPLVKPPIDPDDIPF